MLVIKLDNDVIVSRCSGQVGHSAGPVFVVLTAYFCFRWTFDSQRQTACTDRGNVLELFVIKALITCIIQKYSQFCLYMT